MTPGGQLPPPAGVNPSGAAPGGVGPAPAPPVPDQSGQAQGWIADVVTAVRRLGMKYPDVLPEVRDIMNAVTRMQPKILSAGPAPEPTTPPT
jgi:hypothetical protein